MQMSFLIYFFVLMVSAASVLFGLDLMNSPLPNTPNVPIGRSVQVVGPPPQAQRETRAADERALTPVYPAAPGTPKLQAETSGSAAQQQAGPMPAPMEEAKTEKTEPAIQSTAMPQPVAQQASNSCNVQACGAQYQSFRASDCSYQPSAGPRRACTIVGGATIASAHAPKLQPAARPLQFAPSARQASERAGGDATGQGEMSESERIVRRMTRNESGDIPVQAADGSIVIVRKTYR
jgi:hypothetical protein